MDNTAAVNSNGQPYEVREEFVIVIPEIKLKHTHRTEILPPIGVDSSGEVIRQQVERVITIRHMTFSDAWAWQKLIQPAIRASQNAADNTHRNWVWPFMRAAHVQLAEIRGWDVAPIILTTQGIRRGETTFSEVGFAACLLLMSYVSPESLKGDLSTFVWYVGSAPKDYLRSEYNIESVPSVGRVVLCCSATLSRTMARTMQWLHASPRGGDGLLNYYRTLTFLEGIPSSEILPRPRRNDGRYFWSKLQALENMQAVFGRMMDRGV